MEYTFGSDFINQYCFATLQPPASRDRFRHDAPDYSSASRLPNAASSATEPTQTAAALVHRDPTGRGPEEHAPGEASAAPTNGPGPPG
ncbi:MAG: hypothetical protein U5R14_01590 [Gemmatimonadota bacterium]|nr:hypothetical protein [Gemmatimonadota bacterium]